MVNIFHCTIYIQWIYTGTHYSTEKRLFTDSSPLFSFFLSFHDSLSKHHSLVHKDINWWNYIFTLADWVNCTLQTCNDTWCSHTLGTYTDIFINLQCRLHSFLTATCTHIQTELEQSCTHLTIWSLIPLDTGNYLYMSLCLWHTKLGYTWLFHAFDWHWYMFIATALLIGIWSIKTWVYVCMYQLHHQYP